MNKSISTRNRVRALALAAGVAVAGGLLAQNAFAGTYGVLAPAPTAHLTANNAAGHEGSQTAVLAGGCFWGMEEVFQHVKGVTHVESGYAGGSQAHANYEDSSTGQYGDAEAVKISYDPQQVSYADLLRIYFSVAHNPTQVDRQGPDQGSQYRSEIFAQNAQQARVADAYIQQLTQAHVYDAPIATKVSQHENFFAAEDYHQDYAEKHPDSLYLRINDAPKVAALKTRFPQRYRAGTGTHTASANG